MTRNEKFNQINGELGAEMALNDSLASQLSEAMHQLDIFFGPPEERKRLKEKHKKLMEKWEASNARETAIRKKMDALMGNKSSQ